MFVYERVVQAAVDPVDAEVGEEEEDGELQIVPCAAEEGKQGMSEPWRSGIVVHKAEPAHLSDEPGHGEDGHDGNAGHSLPNLKADLVLEILRVVEGRVVEDEEVGEGGCRKVEEHGGDTAPRKCPSVWDSTGGSRRMNVLGHDVQAQKLPHDVIPVPPTHPSILTRLQREVVR